MVLADVDLMASPISVRTGRRSRRARFRHEFRRFDGPGDSGGTAGVRLGSAYIPLLPVDFFVCASVFFRNFGKFRAGDFFGPAVDLGQSRDFGAWRALRGRGGAFAGWSEGWDVRKSGIGFSGDERANEPPVGGGVDVGQVLGVGLGLVEARGGFDDFAGYA